MRPSEFTAEQIIEAGQALLAKGRTVTGFALAQLVGGGKPARLKQVWDEHTVAQGVITSEPVADLPVEVAEELKKLTEALGERLGVLVRDLNDLAVKTADRRVAEVVRESKALREQAEKELEDADTTVEDLQGQLDKAEDELNGLKELLTAEQTRRQALEVDVAGLTAKLSAAESTVRDTSAQLTEAHAEAKQLSAKEQAARENLAKAEGKLESAQVQLVDAAAREQQLKDELKALDGELTTSRHETHAANLKHTSVQERLQAAERERDTARSDIVTVREDAKSAHAELTTAHADIQRLNADIQRLQSDLIAANKPAAKAPKA
jgi:chromosome segregation ATPase